MDGQLGSIAFLPTQTDNIDCFEVYEELDEEINELTGDDTSTDKLDKLFPVIRKLRTKLKRWNKKLSNVKSKYKAQNKKISDMETLRTTLSEQIAAHSRVPERSDDVQRC